MSFGVTCPDTACVLIRQHHIITVPHSLFTVHSSQDHSHKQCRHHASLLLCRSTSRVCVAAPAVHNGYLTSKQQSFSLPPHLHFTIHRPAGWSFARKPRRLSACALNAHMHADNAWMFSVKYWTKYWRMPYRLYWRSSLQEGSVWTTQQYPSCMFT